MKVTFIVLIAIVVLCFTLGCCQAARDADEAVRQVEMILEEMRSNDD